MIKNINSNIYETSDINKAGFLITAGHRLIKVLRDNNKVTFCFHENHSLNEDLELFLFGNAEVVLKEFISAQRELKELIYNN